MPWLPIPSASGGEPTTVRYLITGLFQPDRADDLRELLQKLPDVVMTDFDYELAEATFAFDAAKLFAGVKPEQIAERLDQLIRQNSASTFGIRPLSTVPRDKLEVVKIEIVGLDCRGCSLAAYEAVAKLDGVEQATASFRDGVVTAWIDPARINRAALEEALTKRNVQLRASDGK